MSYFLSYDTDGNKVEKTSINGQTKTITTGTDEDGKSYVSNDGVTAKTTTDDFGRTTQVKTSRGEGNSVFFTDYEYASGTEENSTSNLVSKLTQKYGANELVNYEYTYDGNGNITQIYENGTLAHKYTYDSLNQLTAEYDYINNFYISYSYDSGGNLYAKHEQYLDSYGYPSGSPTGNVYYYNDTEWKDKLTGINGYNITYDASGNPLSYRDGITFTWQNGRQLSSLQTADNSVSYKYDSNGMRTPVSNSKLTEKMCRVLYSRLKDQKRLSNLARLMNISHENLHNDTYWEKELYSWLFLSEDNTVSSFVVGMVDQIGSFSADIIKPPLSFETVVDKRALGDNQSLYHGITGLQTAVLRFLGNVIERKEKDLYLFSDQNIDWITADKAFQQKWMSLMIQCVTSGVKIHIIHNIERNLTEIGEAIRSWLPLYPSGQIESFYLDGQKNTNFSTTLFLCPGYACIYGNNVVGTENENGNYLYETEPERINLCRQFFDTLLDKAHRLIRVCKTADFLQFETGSSDITVLSSCPTVFSMPENLFSEYFNHSELLVEANDANDIYKQMKRFFEKALLSGHFHECAPLPSDEDLFDKKIYPEFLSTPYSPLEFAEHTKNIINLLDNTKYRFYPLPEPSFLDVQLIISKKSVAVSRLTAPFFTIFLEHPFLCRAFAEYADSVKKQYTLDKVTLKRKLEGYC